MCDQFFVSSMPPALMAEFNNQSYRADTRNKTRLGSRYMLRPHKKKESIEVRLHGFMNFGEVKHRPVIVTRSRDERGKESMHFTRPVELDERICDDIQPVRPANGDDIEKLFELTSII